MFAPVSFFVTVLTVFSFLAETTVGKTSQKQFFLHRSSETTDGKASLKQQSSDNFSRPRRKRNGKIIGVETLNGMRAVRTLLTGAKQTHFRYNLFKQYEKPGTYDQVLKEFNSVHPTQVQDFELPGVVEGKTGRVGDRIILIESEGELGKPIMEIYHHKGTSYERLDRIIYTNR